MTASDNKLQKLKFIIVGVANTALDFGVFLGLNALGVGAILANYISTSVALSFSFGANRKFTFKASGGKMGRQLLLFLVVTLFGLWVLQPIVIYAFLNYAPQVGGTAVMLVVAKLAATVVSLVWNYMLYSRVVFKHAEPAETAGQSAL